MEGAFEDDVMELINQYLLQSVATLYCPYHYGITLVIGLFADHPSIVRLNVFQLPTHIGTFRNGVYLSNIVVLMYTQPFFMEPLRCYEAFFILKQMT